MAFNQFNRAGHRMLSTEISNELTALFARHGLQGSVGGGTIGETELTIKVIVKTNDTQAIEAQQKRELAMYGRFAGLTEQHYNAIITDPNGERYQLKGYNPSRPKYPIAMLNLRTGKMHKGTESYGKRFIAAAQASPAVATPAPSPAAPPSPPSNNHAFDHMAQF